jgi:SAM-dependent methyltransferase
VIEHVFDPRFLLDEIARVLKPGGILLLDTPNIRYAKHLWSLLIGGRFPVTAGDDEDLRLAHDGGHLHYFARRDIEVLLRQRRLIPERFFCLLPPRLKDGLLGELASAFSRLPVFDELLSAELFVRAVKVA